MYMLKILSKVSSEIKFVSNQNSIGNNNLNFTGKMFIMMSELDNVPENLIMGMNMKELMDVLLSHHLPIVVS